MCIYIYIYIYALKFLLNKVAGQLLHLQFFPEAATGGVFCLYKTLIFVQKQGKW